MWTGLANPLTPPPLPLSLHNWGNLLFSMHMNKFLNFFTHIQGMRHVYFSLGNYRYCLCNLCIQTHNQRYISHFNHWFKWVYSGIWVFFFESDLSKGRSKAIAIVRSNKNNPEFFVVLHLNLLLSCKKSLIFHQGRH